MNQMLHCGIYFEFIMIILKCLILDIIMARLVSCLVSDFLDLSPGGMRILV